MDRQRTTRELMWAPLHLFCWPRKAENIIGLATGASSAYREFVDYEIGDKYGNVKLSDPAEFDVSIDSSQKTPTGHKNLNISPDLSQKKNLLSMKNLIFPSTCRKRQPQTRDAQVQKSSRRSVGGAVHTGPQNQNRCLRRTN